MWSLKNNNLYFENELALEDAKDVISCKNSESGAFITVKSQAASGEVNYRIGNPVDVFRFMSCYRDGPLFMSALCGDDVSNIKKETLCLLIKRKSGDYILMLPIYDSVSRGALQYGDSLEINGVTGSDDISAQCGELLYIASSCDPYALMENAAEDLKNKLGSFNLRTEKKMPDVLNLLGWCTWNAFYFDVNQEKVLDGIKDFHDNKVPLGFTLLDDGWLTTNDTMPIGSRVLTDFREDEHKFPLGFRELTKTAKEKYGLKKFFVWHASMGYWGGNKIDGYGENEDVYIKYPSAIKNSADNMNAQFAHHPLKPEKAAEFYNDFHSYLKSVGVDGVKIDVQYLFEGLCENAGGRIKSMDVYRNGLEDSVYKNFDNNCINCMSCSNDMLYRMKNTAVLRSGNDYHPNLNNYSFIASNALNNYWMYPIAFPDWDMFWSNKEDSFTEAVARVASGSPVYVSDEVGKHDYELLKALCLDDGTLLRPKEPGRPTADTLMYNSISDKKILKIFNRNDISYILGAMNLCSQKLEATVSPSDIYGIEGTEFIIFGFKTLDVRKISLKEKINIAFGKDESDLFTVSPVIGGAAVIGLDGKINPSASVTEFNCEDGKISLNLRGGGLLKIYSEKKPESVKVNGTLRDFDYNNNSKIVSVNI